MPLTGRCLCGHVRYELEGKLPPLVNCHCQYCRRAHGAAFATVSWIARSALRFTSGEEALHRYTQGGAFRCFCRHCGTRLFNGLVTGTGFASLIVATLDEEPEQGPVMHINLESKAPWFAIHDGLPQHEGLPAEVMEALKRMERSQNP